MEHYTLSTDGLRIHYTATEHKPTCLVFIHGSLGNAHWWDQTRDAFKDKYCIIQIDLPGHGKSEGGRKEWSSTQYANDIKSVVDDVRAENIILVGHSMSGPYTLEASLIIPQTKMVILVDTLKNMHKLMNLQQADELIFTRYRNDFKDAVENFLPKFVFASTTPEAIKHQIKNDFLQYNVEFAIQSLAPLYAMDIQNIAKRITIPVRAINSDFTPTDATSIKKYIRDYDFVTIHGTGHYPMLEDPTQFNKRLQEILDHLSINK